MPLNQTDKLERLGKYEIVETIGRGGFGIVYKGFDPFLRRFVAIKTCHSERAEIRERFQREARISGRLDHPNIVRTYDSGREGDLPFLVQEYLAGEDLDRKIARGNAGSDRRKLSCLIQLSRGLRYAHDLGVVHRDVKPANIRVLSSGTTKLLDFGIARVVRAASELTQAGTTVGTAAYLAPEQIRGEPVDHRTDVFSFGVTAYELLTGHRPFGGGTISAIYYQILNDHPEPLAALWPACPRVLAEVVRRCLEKEPHRRFGGFAEVAEQLTRIERRDLLDTQPVMTLVESGAWQPPTPAAGLGEMRLRTPTQGHATRPTPASGPPPRRRLGRAVVSLLVLAAAALGALALARPDLAAAAGRFAERLPATLAALAKESATEAGAAPAGEHDRPATVVEDNGSGMPPSDLSRQEQAAERGARVALATEPVEEHGPTEGELANGTGAAPVRSATENPPPGSEVAGALAAAGRQPATRLAARAANDDAAAPGTAAWQGFLSLQAYLGAEQGRVSIDGRPAGRSPLARRPLAPGRHRLEITGIDGGPPQLEATIQVRRAEETIVTFDLSGARPVLVRSRR